jgi:hypothetical protein
MAWKASGSPAALAADPAFQAALQVGAVASIAHEVNVELVDGSLEFRITDSEEIRNLENISMIHEFFWATATAKVGRMFIQLIVIAGEMDDSPCFLWRLPESTRYSDKNHVTFDDSRINPPTNIGLVDMSIWYT